MTKRCPTCGVTKDATEFYGCKRSKDGLKSQCKACHIEGNVRTRDPDNTRRLGRDHMRRARVADPEKFRARERDASRRRPKDDRVRARQLLNGAVRRGEVVRPDECSRCGCAGKVTGHHPDYSKPLEVVWLCYPCHAEEDRRAEAAARAA